jgi:hypothetical protein
LWSNPITRASGAPWDSETISGVIACVVGVEPSFELVASASAFASDPCPDEYMTTVFSKLDDVSVTGPRW